MVKRTTGMAAAMVLVLSQAASGADVATLEYSAQAFAAAHGPATMVTLDPGMRGAIFLGMFRSDPGPADPGLAALAFMETWSGLLGFDPLESLGAPVVLQGQALTHVRWAQVHDSVPVEGSDVVVTLDGTGSVRMVASGYSWPSAFASAVPGISVTEAAAAAVARFPWLEWTGDFRLAYLPSDGGLAPLSWIVLCRSSRGPERPEVYVDAHGGQIAGARDTMRYADANVYDPNPVADSTGPHRVTLPNLTSATRLEGTYARAASCNPGSGWDYCSTTTRYATPDAGGNYLFSPDEPSTTDPFSEVMGYYHMDKINDFMGDTYGVNMMCAGHRWVDAFMNMNIDNAMYGDADEDGCADVTIGQGTHDFGYDAAVIYHEYGHGLNRTQVDFEYWDFDGLGPDWSASGLDEGSADYWAASMSDRPVVGEYASTGTTPGELGFRDLSEFVTCPQGLYGESHYDSPIWSTTLWQIRSSLGQFKTDSLLFDALASMASTADFSSAGSALLGAAAALEPGVLTAADVTVVNTAVADHTLVGCIRVVPLGDEDSHIFIATGYGGYDVPSGVQFSVATPENTTRLTVRFDQLTVGGGYTVFMNRGAPVHFTRSGWDLTIDDYDYEYSGSPTTVSYTPWSDPLIEPGTTYYFTYMHNSEAMMLGVSVDIIVTPVPDSTTDTMEDTTPDTLEDTVADVPVDTPVDTTTEPDPTPDTAEDTVVDTGTDPGTITESSGCGCSLAS